MSKVFVTWTLLFDPIKAAWLWLMFILKSFLSHLLPNEFFIKADSLENNLEGAGIDLRAPQNRANSDYYLAITTTLE